MVKNHKVALISGLILVGLIGGGVAFNNLPYKKQEVEVKKEEIKEIEMSGDIDDIKVETKLVYSTEGKTKEEIEDRFAKLSFYESLDIEYKEIFQSYIGLDFKELDFYDKGLGTEFLIPDKTEYPHLILTYNSDKMNPDKIIKIEDTMKYISKNKNKLKGINLNLLSLGTKNIKFNNNDFRELSQLSEKEAKTDKEFFLLLSPEGVVIGGVPVIDDKNINQFFDYRINFENMEEVFYNK